MDPLNYDHDDTRKTEDEVHPHDYEFEFEL